MSFDPELLSLLLQGATLITPNNRLSDALVQTFFKTQKPKFFIKPACFSYQQFLQQLYALHSLNNTSTPLLLNNFQCQHLWLRVAGLDANPGLIQELQKAWKACLNWDIDFSHPAFGTTNQTHLFQQWAQQYSADLDALQSITPEQLVSFLVSEQTPITSGVFIWYGFDIFTPEQEKLQNYLLQNNCQLIIRDATRSNNQALLYTAVDELDEEMQMVHWLQETATNEDGTIGVIVFDLQAKKERLQRLFSQQLPDVSFNFSYGQVLTQYPIVNLALTCLALDPAQITVEQMSCLLSSPFLSESASEFNSRAHAHATCDALKDSIINADIAVQALMPLTPVLATILATLPCLPDAAEVSEWVGVFLQRLQHFGFPGEITLSSESYQCYQRLLELFDEFYGLGLMAQTLSREEALLTLSQLAKSTVFQAQTVCARVQVLGYLEALGCPFDHVWISGLHENAFPAKVRPSPFIPIVLQRLKKMPPVTPQLQLDVAFKTCERLKNSNKIAVFSYPNYSQERRNLPSPFLQELPAYTPITMKTALAPAPLHWRIEHYEIPLVTNTIVKGGASLITNQAKCPFRAFSLHRLHARRVERNTYGLDARQRGQIIHKTMELMWQQLQNQATLIATEDATLEAMLENAIQKAIIPFCQLRPHSFVSLFQQVEIKRLKHLIGVCLTQEKLRPAFSVDALEKSFTLALGALEITMRLDRLDTDTRGEKWVIDYKTRIPNSMPWFEDRPQEPQLLLYSLLDEAITTLLFISLKAGKITTKGISAHTCSNYSSGIHQEENWVSRRAQWKDNLEKIAAEFSAGYCQPKPINASICQHCEVQSLCRYKFKS